MLIALYLLSIGYSIYTQRFFFGDGAHYFLTLLEKQDFIAAGDFARHAAHYATQFIIVILIKIFHARNLDLLSCAFGLGLYFPQMISLILCYRLLKTDNRYFLLFPIIALFAITMNVSFMIVHESHVISNIFWPIFFYLIFVDDFSWSDSAVILTLAFVFMRSYETAAMLGTLLLVLLAIIVREKWGNASTKTRATWFVLGLVLCMSVVIAVFSAIFPKNPANRAGFLASFPLILKHWPALMSTGYIFFISLCITFPNIAGSSFYKYLAGCLIIFTLYVSLTPVIQPELTRPGLQYAARVYMAYMLPLFSIIAFFVLRGIIKVPDFVWKKITVLVIFLIIGQLTWQILATYQWNGFRRIYKNELTRYAGPVPFESTVLNRRRIGNQLIRPMTWGWTNPTLSILWSKNRDVTTIILNRVDDPPRWAPFDPLVADELPKVEAFGFSFEKYKHLLKSRETEKSGNDNG